MSKFCIILAALLFVQLSSCRVVREAPQQPTQTLAELTTKAEELLKEANTDFLKFIGVKSNEELVEKVQTQTKTFVENAKGQFDDLAKQINNEKTQEFVNNIKKNLEDLVKESPIVSQDAKVLNEKFQTGAQKVIKDVERLFARVPAEGAKLSDDATRLLQSIVNDTVEKAQKLSKTVAQS